MADKKTTESVSEIFTPQILFLAFGLLIFMGYAVYTYGANVENNENKQSIREQLLAIKEKNQKENAAALVADTYTIYVSGRMYGPVELDTLVSWIKNEQVRWDSLVSKNSTEYQKANTLPELHDLFPRDQVYPELKWEWRMQHIDEEIPSRIPLDELDENMYYLDENGVARWAEPEEAKGS